MLTDAKIKGLKPRTARYLKSDGNGLSLDVLPSGKMSWLYRYRLNGKQERVTLGQYPTMSLAEARRRRDINAGTVAKNLSPAEEKRQARENPTVKRNLREFGERYYAEQVVPNWKDPKNIRRYLDKEIYPSLGEKALENVSALDVQRLVYRKRDGGQVQAAIQLRGVIKRLFDYAIETRLVLANPAAMVATRYIGKARKRSRVLSPSEIRLYLHTIYKSNMRRQFKLALHILLLTLLRKSMLLDARWVEINLEEREWTIPKEHVKGRKDDEREHIVYLSTQVVDMLQELKVLAAGSSLVMPGRGSLIKPFAKNALNKALEGLTFDMEPVTIHDLRRTAASLLTEHGFNRDVIEKALSHEAQGIRRVYIVAEYAEQRRKMLQWWADYVHGIVTESKVIIGNFGNGVA
jgi:integrase